MLFIFLGAGGVGRNGPFVVWTFEVGSFNSFVGICLLYTALVGCRGSVFDVIYLLVLSAYGLVMDDFLLVFLVLLGLGIFEFLLDATVLDSGM